MSKDGKLQQFINYPLMGYLFCLYSFVALFFFLHYSLGGIIFFGGVLYLLLICQHLHALRGTLPYACSQAIGG